MRKGMLFNVWPPVCQGDTILQFFSFNYLPKYILGKYQIKGLVFGLGDIKEEEQDMGCTRKHFRFFRIRYDF